MSTPPDPALVQMVLEARRSGQSYAAIAKAAGVSHMTVKRWCDAAEGAPPVRVPTPIEVRAGRIVASPPPEADAEPEPDVDDTLGALRRMWRDALRRAKEAERDGNHTAAQRNGRDAAALANTIARVEREETSDADAIRISRADLAAIDAKAIAYFQAIAARPLLCADCGRALSVAWGTEAAAGPADERNTRDADTRNDGPK